MDEDESAQGRVAPHLLDLETDPIGELFDKGEGRYRRHLCDSAHCSQSINYSYRA